MGRLAISHRSKSTRTFGGFSRSHLTDTRPLEQVAVIEIETSEKISETLLQVVDSLGCWYQYIELFNEFVRVQDNAANLFSYIIELVVHARIYYQQRRAGELALLSHQSI